ncbi:MAG: cobalt-precorrin-5B (C(1))-methyltransferase [Rhodospirillaceae bacterium]
MDQDDIAPDDDIREQRRGWTTGACAAAAAKAAYGALLSGAFDKTISIRLPAGETPTFDLAEFRLLEGAAEAAIEKDAGDDPDVTHGAIIRTRVEPGPAGSGLTFAAGDGVGTVTKPGLPLTVGEPAINPGPRKIIADNLADLNGEGAPDLVVTISVDNGEALAQKTWNPRLGIVGGLSILGTTGIVVPYSCSAWIASIHQAVDVARAAGLVHLAAATGSVSEAAVSEKYGFSSEAVVDMGDFVGGLLKHVRDHPVARLTIAGGFGKLSKLAAGHMDLHSKRSQVDPAFLAGLAARASPELQSQINTADSAGQILELTQAAGISLGNAVAAKARDVSLDQLRGAGDVEILIYDRKGKQVGHAPFGDAS